MFRIITRGRRTAAVALIAASVVLLPVLTPQRAEAVAHSNREHMLQLTNDARTARDRDELAFARALSRYAKQHSRDMAEAGYLFHTDADTLRSVLEPYDWSIGGENLGVGSDLESLQDAFMASKPHRQNLLRRAYDHAAIGVVEQDGRVWVTLIFYG